MKSRIFYSFDNSLEKLIHSKKIIPYQIDHNEKLVKGKWYYEYRYPYIFKVTDANYSVSGLLDYATTITEEGYVSCISNDHLVPGEDYMIEFDRVKLYKSTIINSPILYTGAEIRYWFFINNIDFFNEKYRGFWEYVDTFSPNKVIDKEKYFISGVYEDGIYNNCKLIREKPKPIKKLTKEEIELYQKEAKEQKLKDLHNARRYHTAYANTFNDQNNPE